MAKIEYVRALEQKITNAVNLVHEHNPDINPAVVIAFAAGWIEATPQDQLAYVTFRDIVDAFFDLLNSTMLLPPAMIARH